MLTPGTRLGPYEIVAPLGAGGMGEVYRARDTRLGREVAVKVLPPGFASDADRLRRFEQEARATAALEHPNILAIHDIGTHEGQPYLVAELLKGESLRERLQAGALPVTKAVDLAVQVASGLAAAHAGGIVHRDLKPENLFVTPDGRLKILDFGLAKLGPGPGEKQPTQAATASVGTTPGAVLGTVGYMSPEQVRGEPADHRSDLFALGAILYEMVSGLPAFSGDTRVDTMSAILHADPAAFETVGAPVPPALERIVRHCLEKSPAERFQSARDLAFYLAQLSGTSSAERAALAPLPPRPSSRRRLVVGGGAVALLALLALAGAIGRRTAPHTVPSFSQLTYRQGGTGTARFTADGETVVYFASWDDAPERLYLKRPDAPDALPLELPAAYHFAVSRQGEVALVVPPEPGMGPYYSGVLARAPLAGGAPREVISRVSAVDWAPDGSDLVVVRNLGGRRRLELPPGKVLFETAGHISAPRVSPDGKLVAFLDHPEPYDDRGSVVVVDRSGKWRRLTEVYNSASGLAWSPGGDEIWYTAEPPGFSRSLYAVTTSGRVRLLLRAPGDLVLEDVSPSGRVVLAREDLHVGTLVGTVGEPGEKDLSWLGGCFLADISADGKSVLFTEGSSFFGADYAVCLRRTDGSPPVVLGKGYAYALSPDGAWALASLPSPEAPLQLLPTGPGEAREIELPGLSHRAAKFFPDGRSLLVEGYEPRRGSRLYRLGLDGRPRHAVTPEGELGSMGATFTISPDGRWIATTAAAPGVWLYPIEGGERRKLNVLAEPSFPVRWSADGRAVLVTELGNPARIVRVDVATGARTVVKELMPADPHAFPWYWTEITPDERTYAYGYARVSSQLYLVDGVQ